MASRLKREGAEGGGRNLRREDDGLTDHLASGALGDGNGVGAGARSSTDELVLVGGGPAPVADVALVDGAVLGVTGVTGNHAEALLIEWLVFHLNVFIGRLVLLL